MNKKPLSEAVDLHSFIVVYDHITSQGWTIQDVRDLLQERIRESTQLIYGDARRDKCPLCGDQLVIKRELKEVISFCGSCDYEGS